MTRGSLPLPAAPGFWPSPGTRVHSVRCIFSTRSRDLVQACPYSACLKQTWRLLRQKAAGLRLPSPPTVQGVEKPMGLSLGKHDTRIGAEERLAFLGKLWTFPGNPTLTHLGPRLLLNLDHKVRALPPPPRDDLLPQPHTHHLTQTEIYSVSWGSRNLHPV